MNSHPTLSAPFAFGISFFMVIAMLFLPVLGTFVGSWLYYGEVIDALFDPDTPNGILLALSVYFTAPVIGLLGVGVLFGKFRQWQKIKTLLGIRLPSPKALFGYVGILAVYLLASEFLLQYLNNSPMDFMNGMITPDSLVLLVFAVVVVAPLYEELIFRGVILGAWLPPDRTNKKLLGLSPNELKASLISSILFTLIHLQYDMLGMAMIFGLSLIFSYARIRHGLVLAMILHFINNACAMLMYLLQMPTAL